MALSGCASTPLSTAPAPSATTVRQQQQPQATFPKLIQHQSPQVSPPVQQAQLDAGIVITPLRPSKESPSASPHIALLLPTASRDFGRAAEMVKEGFEAAASTQSATTIPIKVYALDNENYSLIASYQQAIASGARCVIGGLTRDGAAVLTRSAVPKIPTLTLNQVDPQLLPRGPLYTLSLSLEDEARQVAKLLMSQNFSRVGVISGSSPLSKRIRAAFEQEWINMAGVISAKVQLNHNQSDYSKIQSAMQTADAIFIAAEPPLVRQVMPFISRMAPIFGTSQVYDGKNNAGTNADLQGIRFMDMPWMVDPTHAAVAVYPRNPKATSAELDRLYALGIDAYRLALTMAAQGSLGPWLDGVTGEITVRGQQLQRDLLPATIDNDQAVPLKSLKP